MGAAVFSSHRHERHLHRRTLVVSGKVLGKGRDGVAVMEVFEHAQEHL